MTHHQAVGLTALAIFLVAVSSSLLGMAVERGTRMDGRITVRLGIALASVALAIFILGRT
jgi:uncharacterized membrane protein